MRQSRNISTKAGETGAPALTRQRRVVLEVLRASDAHPTAAEVFEAARRRMPTISYATVYNSLRYLRESGMVREVAFGSGASRYDRETARHDHAICSQCGTLADFDLPATVGLMHSAARSCGFEAETVHLTLVGLCPECRRKGQEI